MAKKTKDGKVDSVREKWLSRIGDEDKAHKSWRDRAKLADEAYCNYNTGIDDNQLAPDFPIFGLRTMTEYDPGEASRNMGDRSAIFWPSMKISASTGSVAISMRPGACRIAWRTNASAPHV